jgi:hypothetical protein
MLLDVAALARALAASQPATGTEPARAGIALVRASRRFVFLPAALPQRTMPRPW